MALRLPVPRQPDGVLALPSSEYTITIGGVGVIVRLDWWPRLERWTMGLALADQTILHRGVGLVRGYPLFFTVTNPLRPTGEFFVLRDESATDSLPAITQASLGVDDALYYLTRAEIQDLASQFDANASTRLFEEVTF